MRQIKIALIGAYPYNGNKGVVALTYSSLYLLNRLAETHSIKIDFLVVNSGYVKTSDSITIGDEKICFQNMTPINIFNRKGLIKILALKNLKRTWKELKKVDFILNIGAGDSFADIYGKERFAMFNDQNRLASFFKKPLVFLPQTIGPFDDAEVKKQAINSIEYSDYTFARDAMSYDFLEKQTKQRNISETIDVAFFMPYEKQSFSRDYTHVGINVSALLWNGGYTQNNQFGLTVDYHVLVTSLIDYFLSIDNVQIHIVPHVVGSDSNIENDYEVSYNLVNKYNNPRVVLAPFFLNPIIAKNYIAGMDFFLGARMHSTIAAFSSGVPVVPMAYSRKFNGLFKDTLNYKYMSDMKKENNEQILDFIVNAFEERAKIGAIIKDRLDTIVKERKEVLMSKLSEILFTSKS